MLTTYQDLIDHVNDFQGASPGVQGFRLAARAVQEAYRDLGREFNWPYYYTLGRIQLNPPYGSSSDGSTIGYQAAGGIAPRLVSLTGGYWPSWAKDGYVRLTYPPGTSAAGQPTDGNVLYLVDQVLPAPLSNYQSDILVATDVATCAGASGNQLASHSDYSVDMLMATDLAVCVGGQTASTYLTFDAQVNPGSNIPPGTIYTLFQDTYLLPSDFVSSDQAMYQDNFGGMFFCSQSDFEYQRRYYQVYGVPQYYTIRGSTKYPGRLVFQCFPAPQQQTTIDFLYHRRPRPLQIACVNSPGTMSISSGSTVLYSSSPIFTPSMIGSVVRLSPSAIPPSGDIPSLQNSTPAALETVITNLISPNCVYVRDAAPYALSGVAFTISDLVDVDRGSMLNVLMRGIEKRIAILTNRKEAPLFIANYQASLATARAESNVNIGRQSVGRTAGLQRRLQDYPYTFDIVT